MKQQVQDFKRQLMLDAAKDLFFKNGYSNSTINDVAKAANVSKSTLYAYFDSKETILLNIFLHAAESSRESYRQAVDAATDPYKQLQAFCEQSYQCYCNSPQYIDLFDAAIRVIQTSENLSEEMQARVHSLHSETSGQIIDVLRSGVANGIFRNDLNIEVCADYFINTIQHITIYFIQSPTYGHEEFKTAIEYFLDGLKSK